MRAHKGTDLGGLLQWAALHIKQQDEALAEQPAQQEPVIDHSCKDAYELIMKWADIYAAQTGRIYSEAAQDPTKTAKMADERTMLACAVAQALSQPAQQDTVAAGSLESLKLSMQHSAWDGVLQLSDALKNIDDFSAEQPAQQQEPVAWCLGNPARADSSNVFLAHEFTPDGEHEDEWTPLYTSPPAQLKPLPDSFTENLIRCYDGGNSDVRNAMRGLKIAVEAAHQIKGDA